MTTEHKHKLIVDEREALSAYFNALLSDEVVQSTAEAVAAVSTVAEPRVEVTAAPQVVVAPREVVLVPALTVTEQKLEPETATELPRIPTWGEEKFQVMLFKVSGLSLAVPLTELNGVQEWFSEAITPMPGHASWYLGLVNYRGGQVPVIDTARFVMPADRQNMVSEDINERLHRIVYIGNAAWGLACDEVAEVITIEPEQVRWRSNRTSRRWLAGTVIEQMCALIDPPVFAEMLATGMGADDVGQ
jgi:purine-binding chemotaxis protein CheW